MRIGPKLVVSWVKNVIYLTVLKVGKEIFQIQAVEYFMRDLCDDNTNQLTQLNLANIDPES